MKRIRADWLPHHQHAWERDEPYQNEWLCYLDRETGGLRWLPNENSLGGDVDTAGGEQERTLLTDRSRFVEIPILPHAVHHEIFAAFARTLPDDVQALNEESSRLSGVGPGKRVYSIGGFLKEVEECFPEMEIRDDWHGFREAALRKRADAWYRNQGFVFEWDQ